MMMRDPVCEMTVCEGVRLTVDGYPEYGFCSQHCREAFLAEPARYVGEAAGDREMDEQEPGERDDHPAHVAGPAGVAVAAPNDA
jgi:YHS domain-containing protein